MGRARSRRRRGKTGGQGSGGSGTGGSGGSRGRSSNNRGGQGSGGSGSGKGTGGSKGRSTANRTVKKNRLKVKAEKTKQENKQKRVDRRNERLKKQFGLDYNDMKDSFRIKINPTQWLGGFTEKTGIPTGLISRNLPGFIKNMKIDHQLKSPNKVAVKPGDSKWGGGVAKDILLATQAKQAQKAQQKAEEKALDKQYKNDQAIYNNNNKNNMALTDKQSKLNQIYLDEVGRGASYGTKGGADYWLDTHAQGDNVDWDNIRRMIGGSDEGKKFKATGNVRPGGIDPTKSISSQSGWADHFKKGGVFENENAAGAITNIANDIGFTPSEAYFNNSVGGGNNNNNGGGNDNDASLPADGWWNQFADADAFKEFLQGDAKEETKADNGMGDFMKFMMLMNVMGGGRGGGGGYGGSQFGYGGMSPGGVQAAYDPMKQLQGMGTWFKDNFGSGSTSTGNINAT